MAVWKCQECGNEVEVRCKPAKCQTCGASKEKLAKEASEPARKTKTPQKGK